MSGTPFEPGQFASVNAAVTLALPKAIGLLDPKRILAACERGGERLSRYIAIAFDSLLKNERDESELLQPWHHFDMPETTETFNPAVFKTRTEGIMIWDGFESMVLRRARKSKGGRWDSIGQLKPQPRITDAEIEAELKDWQYFDESNVCRVIYEMIGKQPNGEEGALSTTGPNLFYLRSGVVHVMWHKETKQWGLQCRERGVARWLANGLLVHTAR